MYLIDTDIQNYLDLTLELTNEQSQELTNDQGQDYSEDCPLMVGPYCSINVADKQELFRLTEELEDLQRWFEEYGQEGILFPHSIINAFPYQSARQAA